MKAILKFDLNDPGERLEYKRANKSLDMALALWEILYNAEKRCTETADTLEADSDKYDGIYVSFQEIRTICNDHNINIDELID